MSLLTHPFLFRVAVVFVVSIVILLAFAFAFVFLLVFFIVWCFPEEGIGSYRVIRGVSAKVPWIHSVHAQWYASPPQGNDTAWTAIMTVGAVTILSSFRSSDLSQFI
jgi:hypothetical protein